MAAQAVDITLSGHVNRALIIADRDPNDSTSAKSTSEVRDNASSGTRIRVTGSGEMMDGQSAGVNLEYGAGGSGGDSLSMRYAEVYFSGGYGKLTIGQGDQGGEGSFGVDKLGPRNGVLGIGHGQDNAGVTKVRQDKVVGLSKLGLSDEAIKAVDTMIERGISESRALATVEATVKDAVKMLDYYISLDGGADRNERIRYDTPSAGAFSAAVSVGNGDQVSAGIKLDQDFGGTEFSAALGTIRWPKDKSSISGSAGVKFASGVTISGAWGEGKDHEGMLLMSEASIMKTTTDPSVYQTKIGYVFGDTSVAGSWYKSSDAVNEGSELTAFGFGINHYLPGIDTNVYVAAQNYKVEDPVADHETDDTVVMIGARVKF